VHLAVTRLAGASPAQHRQVFEGLRAAGIGVQLHYSPVHLQPYYRGLGFGEGQFPESEAYASSSISLPLFPGLTAEEQERVAAALSQQLEQMCAVAVA
jgi:dTDP-4-amino-4,6-dideoxygalactose transaminase